MMTLAEEKENKEEFEECIKHEIERVRSLFDNDDLMILWLAVIHEATGEMLKERNLTPFGAFIKWKEGEENVII